MPATPEFDFYASCAKYWALSRLAAKVRVCFLYVEAGAAGMDDSFHPFLYRMQPLVLQKIPTEARFEMLAHYGIVLGDS